MYGHGDNAPTSLYAQHAPEEICPSARGLWLQETQLDQALVLQGERPRVGLEGEGSCKVSIVRNLSCGRLRSGCQHTYIAEDLTLETLYSRHVYAHGTPVKVGKCGVSGAGGLAGHARQH